MTNGATSTVPATFQVGATYEARSICDHNCVWSFRVIARTAKFVTLEADTYRNYGNAANTKRVGVGVWDGVECASPLGTYSMSPTIRANRTVA